MPHATRTEYKVVPAPERARKVRGLKGAALFAHEMEAVMNDLAADGWRYVRADTLPQEERAGLTSKVTTYRNLLIFQRDIVADATITAPAVKSRPTPAPNAADTDDDIDNLWQPDDGSAKPAPTLRADRQGKRVDF